MKILQVYKTYYPESIGGIEKLIYSLSSGLAKQGITSDVLTTTHQSQAYVEQVADSKVYFYPCTFDAFSCPTSLSLLTHFKKIAAQYDVIHYHFPWPFMDAVHLLQGTNKPSVVTYHSDIVKQKLIKPFYAPLMHQFFKKINAIVSTSENLAKTSPVLQVYSEKTTVIPIGIDKSLYPKPTEELIASWKNRVGHNFILFVGILRYYKGLEFLLDAVKNTTIPLVIVGSGPEEKKLKAITEENQLNNVVFVGQVSEEDKIALIKLSRAVIAPAHLRSEAFCISLLEGLMFNKPLISTEIGTGTSFVNQNNVSGLVVAPRDPQALKIAMEKLLKDDVLYARLQAGSQAHYEKYFTGEKMTSQYIETYKSLL